MYILLWMKQWRKKGWAAHLNSFCILSSSALSSHWKKKKKSALSYVHLDGCNVFVIYQPIMAISYKYIKFFQHTNF